MSKTVILGAGVDSLSGIAMPLTSELIPQIVILYKLKLESGLMKSSVFYCPV